MSAQVKATEHTMKSWDGVELFYRAWRPERPSDKALLIFHRGHEHSGRMKELVEDLRLEDFSIFAWDARGHGRSPGERGYAADFSVLVRDVDAFVNFVARRHAIPIENMAVLAHSVGAVTVSGWVHDYAPPIRALVLATPAFRVKLYVPFAIPGLRLKQRLLGNGYVKSYVKAKLLTHDLNQAESYHKDEFIFRQIADNILLDLYDVSTRIVKDAGAIHVPVLLLSAGSDWVVKLSTQREFFERLFARAAPLRHRLPPAGLLLSRARKRTPEGRQGAQLLRPPGPGAREPGDPLEGFFVPAGLLGMQ